jgi:hypothetical protein
MTNEQIPNIHEHKPGMTLDEAIEHLARNQYMLQQHPDQGETLEDVQYKAGQHYKELLQRCDHRTLRLAHMVVYGY